MCCAGVEAALQAMPRQGEAVAYCPTSQLRGGSLVPDPPQQEASGRAAEDYAEVKLQLLDFSQVGTAGWRAAYVALLRQLAPCLHCRVTWRPSLPAKQVWLN